MTTDTPIPKLNLGTLPADVLPKLEAVVRNTKHEIIAHVEAPFVALIVSPQNKILHLEAACSSDAGAHALMGCISDPRGAVTFRYFAPGGAVLAALRYWQSHVSRRAVPLDFRDYFVTHDPLKPAAIDRLCERLNG